MKKLLVAVREALQFVGLSLLSVGASLIGLLGFGLLIVGVRLYSVPASYITAGLLLMAWSLLAEIAAAARPVGKEG